MPDYFAPDLFSLARADQTAYDVANGSPTWVPFLGTFPQFTLAREMQDLALSLSQDFAMQPKVVGSRAGSKVTFSVPLRSQLPTYDPSAGNPVENPEIYLLRQLMSAKHTGAYAAGDVAAGSTGGVVKLTAGDLVEGACYLFGSNSAKTIRTAGWIKDSNTSPTPNEMTLIEDCTVVPVAADDVMQTLTLYSDNTQPTYQSLRLKGKSDDHDFWLIGAVCESAVIDVVAGQVPMIAYTYDFTDWDYKSASGDGLLTATDYLRLPPAMGVHESRIWLNGVADSDGSAELVGTCGLGNLRIEITRKLRPVRCASAQQKVSNMIAGQATAKASFFLPHTTDWVTGTESDFDDSLENATGMSLSWQVGEKVGQFFGGLIPNGVVSAQPNYGPGEDEFVGWNVEITPEEYSADTGTTDPANKPFRLTFG